MDPLLILGEPEIRKRRGSHNGRRRRYRLAGPMSLTVAADPDGPRARCAQRLWKPARCAELTHSGLADTKDGCRLSDAGKLDQCREGV